MKKLISLFFILSFTLCSCQTSGYLQDNFNTAKFYKVSHKIFDRCFAVQKPQFLAQFHSSDIPADLEFEGIWNSEFNHMTMQALGLFGEVLATVELNQDKLSLNQEAVRAFPLQTENALVTMMDSLGSENLRKIFCGYFIFSAKDFLRHQTNPYRFRSETEMTLKGQKITWRNEIFYRPGTSQIEVKSKILTGIFRYTLPYEVFWTGHFDDQRDTIVPKKMKFKSDNNFFELTMLYYE